MTPGARLQAAIELLGEMQTTTSPADRVSAAFFRGRRYMGGQDRRDVIERTYRVLRRRAALDWWVERAAPGSTFEDSDRQRARVIATLALVDHWDFDRVAGSFDGGQYRPPTLDSHERRLLKALSGKTLADAEQPLAVRYEIPAWLEDEFRAVFGDRLETELAALMGEPATDLRTNTLKANREQAIAALAKEGVEGRPTPLSPLGIRVASRPPLASLQCFKAGLIEVQDEGSQLIALLTEAKLGSRVVDFCAGAGGKTLALAAAMNNKGKLVATDVLKGRIERASTRLNRAGVHNVERHGLTSERDPWVKRHVASFDRVLVDAPCSGSGTWRRNPDAKWRLKPSDIDELIELQRRILVSASRLVKPGGRLAYATCSLLPRENGQQVDWFLSQNPDFTALPVAEVWRSAIGGEAPASSSGEGPYLSLTPASHGTDGFFIAILQRKPKVAA